ncbi:hypothetical protein K488DRAFT_32379, partial [Vararia minispora EC-137]
VIDALDECPEPLRKDVLVLLEHITSQKLSNLRLLATSRPEADIEFYMDRIATHRINLHSIDSQAQDLGAYVSNVLTHDQSFQDWSDELISSTADFLSENANGMFRWVYCQLETLRFCLPKNVSRTLETLPKTLDETYERILRNIDNSVSDDARRIFHCIAFARIPLSVDELAEIFAIDFTTIPIPTHTASFRVRDPETRLRRMCSGLIDVVDVHRPFQPGPPRRVVQFAHFSVKEFLLSDRLAMGPIPLYHINTRLAHTTLAQMCITTL